MAILNYAKLIIAYNLGRSGLEFPNYFMIGSGSGIVVNTQTSLISPTDRQLVTSTDILTSYKTKWQGDWSSVEVSGLQLKEFGVCGSSSTTTGSMWSRVTFPAITFDGTNELRIEETWEVY